MISPTAVRRRQEIEMAAGMYTHKELKMKQRLAMENFGRARQGKERLTEADLLIQDTRKALEEEDHKRLIKKIKKLRRK